MTPSSFRPSLVLLAVAACASVANGAEPAKLASKPVVAAPAPTAATADVRAHIASKIPGTRPDDVRQSPVPGIFEVARGTEIAYVSSDAKYAIAGDLIDLAKNDNLTEARRRDARLALIKGVSESEMLVFAPQRDAKYTVTVFTDVDCGYCRKLHSQMAEYNKLGIRVRYLLYPRNGRGDEAWDKAVNVWCAPDRNEALTRAKRGEAIKSKPCGGDKIVARDYELGQDFGLRGTPAILLADGDLIPGYLPPAMLAQRLKEIGR